MWVAILALAAFVKLRAERTRKKHITDWTWKFLLQGFSAQRKTTKLVLHSIAFIAAVLALARPQFGASRQEIKAVGVEIMVALDVSNSMLAEDVRPNRLELAKRQIARLLDRLSGDKVGLIAFAGTAMVISPLTTDYSAVRMFVDSLTVESISNQGTVFKNVIQEAIEGFERGGDESDTNKRVARVLLIVTDGEDQEPGAEKLASQMRDKGLRVFAWGIGTRKGAPIPVRDQRGYLSDYKKDRNNQVILSVANDQALEALARSGGGSYYHSTLDGDDVEAFRADIAKLEKAEFDTQIQTNYDEVYYWPLILAFVLLFFDLWFFERVPSERAWLGRWVSNLEARRTRKSGLTILIAVGALLGGGGPARAQSPSTVWKNRQGLEDLGANRSKRAYDRFSEALKDSPDTHELQYNLGISLLANKELENAESQFKASAASTQNPKLKFMSHFNAGVTAGLRGNIDQALSHYQAALEVDPSSEQVKTNIELLFKSQSQSGENQDQKQGGEGDPKGDPKDDPKKKNVNQPKPSPRPFKSEELTERDMKNILDEIKRQEEQVRGRLDRTNAKDKDNEKDW